MQRTDIEWCTHVWNPVTGCSKASVGCDNCYAKRLWPRLSAPGQPYAGRKFSDIGLHPERLDDPLVGGAPKSILVCSMGDLFHQQVPFEFIAKVFTRMKASKHTFYVLTKRHKRMAEFLKDGADMQSPNIWLGVSVENDHAVRARVPALLSVAGVSPRFISAEPLLGEINLVWHTIEDEAGHPVFMDAIGQLRDKKYHGVRAYPPGSILDWVIVGGETGPHARAARIGWLRSIRNECSFTNTPFFFKGWGAGGPERGRELDGRVWDQRPII